MRFLRFNFFKILVFICHIYQIKNISLIEDDQNVYRLILNINKKAMDAQKLKYTQEAIDLL
jgi:hypothetical protein